MIPAKINDTVLLIPQTAEEIQLGQMISLSKDLSNSMQLLGKEHKDYARYSEEEFEVLAECEYAIILVSNLCMIEKDKITNGSSWKHLVDIVAHLNELFATLEDPNNEVVPVNAFELDGCKYMVKSVYRDEKYGREFSDKFTVKDYIDSSFLSKKAAAIAYKNQYEQMLSICTIICFREGDDKLNTEQLVLARKTREKDFNLLPLSTAMELYFFFVQQWQTLASVSNLFLTTQLIAELSPHRIRKDMEL
jgi:hypothetical protein